MNKKYAIILALAITLIIASDFYLIKLFYSNDNHKESVFVSRVIDGDTLILNDSRRIRLLNINAPEKSSPLSTQATAYLKKYENKSLEIQITGVDIYKRYLARLYSPNYLNLNLVSLGLASKFLVQDTELKQFADAESNAIANSKGIWKKSKYFGCFDSKIDEKTEIVTLTNKCNSINIMNWYVKDESRKTYTFGSINLGKINLHSSIGKDNSTDIFWNSKTAIWNNDRDTLYLFDSYNNIAYSKAYGY